MTQHYVGTKIVMAWSQAHADGREGYTVKYSDGYTSWCPRTQFEEASVAIGHVAHLPQHQQRVIAEREQLADRIQKLEAFLHTELFASLPDDEQQLLKMQADAMVLYLGIINTRTSKFA